MKVRLLGIQEIKIIRWSNSWDGLVAEGKNWRVLQQAGVGTSGSVLKRREFHDVAVEICGRRIVRVEKAAIRAERGSRHDKLIEEVEGGHRLTLLVSIAHKEVVAAANDRRPRWAPGGRQPEDAVRLGRRRWETKGSGSTCLRLDSISFLFLSLSLSSYTGSSRHRVARLSTLFHVFTSPSFSFFLSRAHSPFLSFPIFLSFSPPFSFSRLFYLFVSYRLSAFHRRFTVPFIFPLRGLSLFSLEFGHLAGAWPSGWCMVNVRQIACDTFAFITG